MLSLIIPTYEERDNLEPLLTRVQSVRRDLGEPLEVLIVDHHSQDGTGDRARQLMGRLVEGRVIQLTEGRGLARAVIHGIREASGDLIGVMDADLSHPPELLPTLVRAVRAGKTIAVASRYAPGGGVVDWSWRRQILSRAANAMARPLVPVADATSGYFVCQAGFVKSLALSAQGFKILLEILVHGYVRDVCEVPYVFRNRVRGASKLDGRVMWRYLKQLARLYRDQRRLLRARER